MRIGWAEKNEGMLPLSDLKRDLNQLGLAIIIYANTTSSRLPFILFLFSHLPSPDYTHSHA